MSILGLVVLVPILASYLLVASVVLSTVATTKEALLSDFVVLGASSLVAAAVTYAVLA